MFSRVLIANRGEIAVRVARSVQSAGASAVAVFSDADREALHVGVCDLAVALGGLSAAESYLDMDKILAAARSSGADAVHPGYGFLSENAEFARRCIDAGLTFIGPSPEAIEVMGNKRAAKILVSQADVPCIPGYEGEDQSDARLREEAVRVGFPVMVKAAAGGGGRGMRVVNDADALPQALQSARSEAKNAFGSDEMILERVITGGRHIEIQVAADAHGNVVHLGERDCSLQRRHQKVIEEAPSPFVTLELREAMGQAAVNAARCCDYLGVGTVEFLVAEDRTFCFLEMNTRLQVEHPVTELVTGIDLVDLQLLLASGEPLPFSQQDVQWQGHAIEARLYAEDPAAGFMPQTGAILTWQVPDGPGVRVDAGIAAPGEVGPHYDSMVAKIIASGSDREQARNRLIRALQGTVLLGVNSNRAFLTQLLEDQTFVTGNATTAYIDDSVLEEAQRRAEVGTRDTALAVVALLRALDPQPAHFANWSNVAPIARHKTLLINDQEQRLIVRAKGDVYQVTIVDEGESAPETGADDGSDANSEDASETSLVEVTVDTSASDLTRLTTRVDGVRKSVV